MRQINFAMIFGFGLVMVYFTLENTPPTTVHIVPGVSTSLPLAALLLISAGFGAFFAWLFGAWIGVLRNVESINRSRELEANQVRIQELENDINLFRSGLNVLPSSSFSNGSSSTGEEYEANVA